MQGARSYPLSRFSNPGLKVYASARAREKWAPQTPGRQLKGGAREEPVSHLCIFLTGADVLVELRVRRSRERWSSSQYEKLGAENWAWQGTLSWK